MLLKGGKTELELHGQVSLGNAGLASIKQVSLLEYFSERFKILMFV